MTGQNVQKIIGVISFFLFASAAFADCDQVKYDQTPPPAISSEVNNGIVHFVWSTDLDTIGGRNWIWHFIKNVHPNHGLGYKWPKAELRRALGSPLEAGKTDCNRYFVTTSAAPDDDAPITYGTSDTPQRAAVYVPSQTAGTPKDAAPAAPGTPAGPVPEPPATGSIIETSYKSGAGKLENVRVSVSTNQRATPNGQGWLLQVERTTNVIVAIGMRFLNNEQSSSVLGQFSSQSVKVDAGPLPKMIGRNDKEVLSEFFSESELASHADQSYFVFYNGGNPKGTASLPAPTLRPISTDVILFDVERRPFFATTFRILAPR